jgi:hypothetical protein
MRGLVLTAVLLSLAATRAWCDGPVSTAPAGGAIPTASQTPAPPPLGADDAADSADDVVAPGPCGPSPISGGDQNPNSPHGQVDVSVGTGGYRSVGGSVCKPLGEKGAASVSVYVGQGDERWGRGR